MAWKQKRQNDDDHGEDQFLFGLPHLDQDVVAVAVFAVIQAAMWEVTGDLSLRSHHLRHSCASWSFFRLCVSDFLHVPDVFPNLPRTTALLQDSARFRSIMYSAFGSDTTRTYTPEQGDIYAVSGPRHQHAFIVAKLMGHADPSTTLEHYIHLLEFVVPLYRRTSEFFPLSREMAITASGFSRATGYRYNIEDLPAEVWRNLPEQVKGRASSIAPPRSQLQQAKSSWIDTIWRLLYTAETERLTIDELAAEFGVDVGTVSLVIHRAGLIREMRAPWDAKQWLHTMTWWTPDRRHPNSKIRLCCPYRPASSQDRAVIDRFEQVLPFAIAADPTRAERVFDYFVKHQRGLGPLIFDDPTDPDAARDYLAFLEAMRIQRIARSSRASEIRFVSYDPATRSPALQQWRRAIPLKSRDEIEPHSDNGPEQRLGILAHFQLAPGRPLVGNMGFRFVMLMGAIAHPVACSPGKPTIFHHSGKL